MQTTTNLATRRSAGRSLDAIGSIRAWIAAWFDAAQQAREAGRLYDLSSAQLAQRGLTRDAIFGHVFGR